ncbi:MAG: 50S ribosomal protein L21e [archaeon]
MRRSRGFRNKTRQTLKQKTRAKLTITQRLKEIEIGSKVVVYLQPSFQNGMPHPRYHGTIGSVIEKRGRAYILAVKDQNKPKTLIASPEHIKPLNPNPLN